MSKNVQKSKEIGFTLIELLVVIAIIGVLATVVIAALGPARERAQITRMVSDLQQIELALNMWMTAEGKAIWPEGSEVGPNTVNATLLSEMVSEDGLGQYLSTVPESPFSSIDYTYENNGDSRNACGGPYGAGVNIVLNDIEEDIMEEVSSIVDNDDGDLTCGKVVSTTASAGNFRYNLSLDQGF